MHTFVFTGLIIKPITSYIGVVFKHMKAICLKFMLKITHTHTHTHARTHTQNVSTCCYFFATALYLNDQKRFANIPIILFTFIHVEDAFILTMLWKCYFWMFLDHFDLNVLKTYFLGYVNMGTFLFFIILQTLWKRYFWIFSEHSNIQKLYCNGTVDEHPIETFQRKAPWTMYKSRFCANVLRMLLETS